MSNDIEISVYSILNENAPKPPGNINADTELELIGLGSLEVVEAIFDLEERFDITIPNPGESADISTEFKTAGEIVLAVKQLIELEAAA